jgi:hypothetical protein
MSAMKRHEENCSLLCRSTAGRMTAIMDLGIRLRLSVLSVMGNITPGHVTFKVLSFIWDDI